MKRAAAAISAALIAAVFLSVLLGVARRYLFGVPLVWIDELATVLFIWAIFWTAAFVVTIPEHVAFDLVHLMLPPPLRRAVAIAAAALVGVALLAALPKLAGFVAFLWRERTPALQWRLDYVYFCFTLFIAAAGIRFLCRTFQLSTRRWREHL